MTAPLLRTFIESCALHEAGPTEAQTNDVRCFIKCVLPVVFEPVDNEFVAFGVTFSNSDFGAGRLKLSGVVMRITSGTTSVLEDAYSKTHLGSVIQDSDIEMSDETKLKELETVRSAIKDTVNGILSFETLERNIKAIQIAHEKEIPWYKLKDKLRALLNQKELDMVETLLNASGTGVIDLPRTTVDAAGGPVATAWWAANTLSWLASNEEDPSRKNDLQEAAGKMIT